jgi:hypothetical protein
VLRLFQDAAEPPPPPWPANRRKKWPPQSQSGSVVSARRVPRGENSGARRVLSKQHANFVGRFCERHKRRRLTQTPYNPQRFRSQLSVPYFWSASSPARFKISSSTFRSQQLVDNACANCSARLFPNSIPWMLPCCSNPRRVRR